VNQFKVIDKRVVDELASVNQATAAEIAEVLGIAENTVGLSLLRLHRYKQVDPVRTPHPLSVMAGHVLDGSWQLA
jgi:predicted transcriptional regulator